MPQPRRRFSIPARLREAGPISGPRQRRATKAGERPALQTPVQTAAPEVPQALHLAQATQPTMQTSQHTQGLQLWMVSILSFLCRLKLPAHTPDEAQTFCAFITWLSLQHYSPQPLLNNVAGVGWHFKLSGESDPTGILL